MNDDSEMQRLGARDAAQAIAARKLRSEALAEALLDRIARRDSVVHAWAHVDREDVLRQARHADAHPSSGLLHGVPIGWKDVIDCAGLPTACGSPIYRGNVARIDAAAVAMSRREGALVLGKTVTAEFAASRPGTTTHPQNPAHTPGGSSSGSAAAVADGMVPLAVGTQTGGSVIRPASFCGIVGFKPSYGFISRQGVKQLAESFDTVGTFARSVDDTALLVAALTGRKDFADFPPTRPVRVALWQGPDWGEAEAPMRAAIDAALSQLSAAGVTVSTAAVPTGFERMAEAHKRIEYFELARGLQHEYRTGREELSGALVSRIEFGLALAPADYESALAARDECRRSIADVFASTDLLLAPAATGEAPKGLASTGKATFNRLWTALGTPAITLPHSRGPNGLPLGLQFIAAPRRDAALIAHAGWIEDRLARALPAAL